MEQYSCPCHYISVIFTQKSTLFYSCLKVLVRLFRPLFFRSIRVNNPACLQLKGPVLIAANHPNSFLDAIMLDILFQQPIWSLARGDVFKNKLLTRLLTAIKILPVYRVSEGVENLTANYDTFNACKEIFRKNGIVLIFSEGLCINEWHLRPLKKGTARLTLSSWSAGIPVSVLPVGINYNSFRSFGKDVVINIGVTLKQDDMTLSGTDGQQIQAFNELLTKRLQPLVFEISNNDTDSVKRLVCNPVSPLLKFFLAIPALAGWLLHQPVYLPLKSIAAGKAARNGHYDSVLAALLFLTYPFYLLFIFLIIVLITNRPDLGALVLLLPFTAFCYTQYGSYCKKQ